MMDHIKINIDVVEEAYNSSLNSEIMSSLKTAISDFNNSTTYKELNSSSTLNFSNYIESKKAIIEKLEVSYQNLLNFVKECVDNHYGIDSKLSETVLGNITDANSLNILNTIKVLSEYDRDYNEESNHPIIDYTPTFNYLISKSDFNFEESYTVIDSTTVDYNTNYTPYESEQDLVEVTSSSALFENYE